jgi:chaperonin GroEL
MILPVMVQQLRPYWLNAMVTEGMKTLAAGANPMLLKIGIEAATKAASEAISKTSYQSGNKRTDC